MHSDHDDHTWRTEVKYRITAPPGLSLSVSTVNGAVSVLDLTAPMDLSTVNGKIDVTRARREAKLNTVNGAIRVHPVAGKPAACALKQGGAGTWRDGSCWLALVRQHQLPPFSAVHHCDRRAPPKILSTDRANQVCNRQEFHGVINAGKAL